MCWPVGAEFREKIILPLINLLPERFSIEALTAISAAYLTPYFDPKHIPTFDAAL